MGPEWHYRIAKPASPKSPPPANLIIFCKEVPIKAVEVGDLFVFGMLMNKNGLGHQTWRDPAIPPGRGFFSLQKVLCVDDGSVDTFQPVLFDPSKL